MENELLNLIQGAEVEWKPLSELTNYEQPSKYLVKSTKYSDEFETPVLTAGKTFILGYTDEIDGVKKASINPVILFDDFTSATRWIDFDFKVKSSATKFITSKDESELMLKFLYYWLMTLQNVEVYSAEHKRLWISNFSQTKIPIPSLEIQQKVVKILDKMTDYVKELTAELTAELTLRQKQYSYYRDQLLTFPSQSDSDESLLVRETTLGEVATIKSGRNKDKNDYGKYNVFGSTGVIAKTDQYLFDKDMILVARVGANAGYVHIATGKYDVSDNTLIIAEDSESVNQKFLFHLLTNMNLNQFAKGGGQPLITATVLKNLAVPLPSLKLQSKIVEILDKFQALTEDVSGLLPEEIALRQKQYEYYREQLLSFKKE